MHLSPEQLLAACAGDGAAEERAHLAACPECAAEVERLRALAADLAALPTVGPPRDLWPTVRGRVVAERGRRRMARAGWMAAGLAATFTLAIGMQGAIEAWHEARLARQVKTLVAQSQQLEKALHAYADGGRVVSGRTAGAIVQLEDRIAVIDAQLGRKRSDTPTSPDVVSLWQERVRLLDALVNVKATRVAYVGL